MSHLPAPALPHSRPPLITLVTQPSPYLRPAVTSAGHIFFRPKKTSWQPGLQVSPGLHAPPENQNQIEDAHASVGLEATHSGLLSKTCLSPQNFSLNCP